jgi:hypothetical protein
MRLRLHTTSDFANILADERSVALTSRSGGISGLKLATAAG